MFRIEDIVCHTLIKNDEEIFFAGDFKNKIGSSIITTGNELENNQLVDFSSRLNIAELYKYISKVYEVILVD